MLKHIALSILLALLATPHASAEELNTNTKRSIVFIASYDAEGDWLGWGSGFFIDEGIVVSNKHVIDGAARYYKIFATGKDDRVDINCSKVVTRSDIKINLEDDVAYIRVYLEDCEHGIVHFVDVDPETGERLGVIGYPNQGSLIESLNLTYTSGVVSGKTSGPWLKTDAYMHFGNSGGPVVQDGKVIGVAVAKLSNEDGSYASGYFVPMSVVRKGLSYANDSTFGYVPQEIQNNTIYNNDDEIYGEADDPFNPIRGAINATNSDCKISLGQGGEATGAGGCRCKASYHKSKDGKQCSPGSEGYIDPYSNLGKQRSTTALNRDSMQNPEESDLFEDYDENNHGYEAVSALKKAKVISGYPDGTFKPAGDVNRAELLKIIVEGYFSNEVKGETNCFPDVKDEWFAPYVCAAKRLGWVGGYPDGTFRPANAINRAEGIKILLSSLTEELTAEEYMPSDVPEDSWFYDYVAKGLQIGVIDSHGIFRPGVNLTREEAAVWIYNGTN